MNRIDATAESSQRTSPRLRANALGVGAITFFVISAAGPLVAMAGGVPVAMLLPYSNAIPIMGPANFSTE